MAPLPSGLNHRCCGELHNSSNLVSQYYCVCVDSVPSVHLISVLWCCWLGGRKSIRPVKTEWWGVGVVVCLEWGIHPFPSMLFLPFPLKSTFLAPAHPGSLGKGPLNGCVCWQCDYENIPTTIFTPLEYGCIGLTEEQALAKYGDDDIEVYHSNFFPLEWTVPHHNENACYAKLICVPSLDVCVSLPTCV